MTFGCPANWKSRWPWRTIATGLIYGRTVRFYPSGLERDYDQAHEFTLLPEGDIFNQLFTDSCFIAMSSAVFRRAAVEAIGGIPDAIQIVPDYWLYVAVARRYPVRAVQEVVCRYRMHGANMSRLTALKMNQEVLWLIDQWADRPRSANRRALPQEALHRHCAGGDAEAGHRCPGSCSPVHARLGGFAVGAAVHVRVSHHPPECSASLLAELG